jgi:hypothetical protein
MSNEILIQIGKKYNQYRKLNTGVPELAPQRKQTNANDNLRSKNANEEQLMACIREL